MDWFGWIVLADIPDPDGKACSHPHPAMVLRGPDSSGALWLIGISTKFDSPPGRLIVECPWAEGGHEMTGLTQPCALKCRWVVQFDRKRLIKYLGQMPSEIASLAVEYAITAMEEKRATEGSRANSRIQEGE